MIDVILFITIVVLPAVILHEYAHGLSALWLGDTTAKRLGRLTLNPLPHLDPIGSVILPGGLFLLHALNFLPSLVLFGWAKPVPVDFSVIRPWRLGMCLVAGAGPLVNILLAGIFVLAYKFLPFRDLDFIWGWGIVFNLTLAVFNMLPIPPLDGSKFVYSVLPADIIKKIVPMERWGFVILIILLNMRLLDFLFPVIRWLASILGMAL